jgi:hypothetical protein
VGVNRRIPIIGESFQRTSMIEVPVRHQNGSGPRVLAESIGGCALNCACETGETGIDQNPLTIGRARLPKENHIDDREPFVSKIVSDLVRAIVVVAVNLWMVRATFIGQWDLSGHG